MFESYDNIPTNYIPNNMFPKPMINKLGIENSNFNVMYDQFNCIKGYEWNYGDTGTIPLPTNIDIRVYPGDIICDTKGVTPDKYYTRARKGDRFYNIIDVKSWQLNAIIARNRFALLTEEPKDFEFSFYYYYKKDSEGNYIQLRKLEHFQQDTYFREDTTYIWVEDTDFTFYNDGVTPVKVTPDMTGKTVFAEICNFRHERLSKYDCSFYTCKPLEEDIPEGKEYTYFDDDRIIYVVGTKKAESTDTTEYLVRSLPLMDQGIAGQNIFIKYKVELVDSVPTWVQTGICTNNDDNKMVITTENIVKLFPGVFYLNYYIKSDDQVSKINTYELHIKG